MLSDAVRTRLLDEVDALAGRVQLAGDLSDLVKHKAMPAAPVFAFVLPLGINGGEADLAAGAYRQAVDHLVAVLIGVNRAGDQVGAKSLPAIDELEEAVIRVLCGWAPQDEPGSIYLTTSELRLVRGQLLQAGSGLVLYQIDFALTRQVRVLS